MLRSAPRWPAAAVLFTFCLLAPVARAGAEVVSVTIAKRSPVADGMAFGRTGPYEKLQGTIEIALDPSNAHNRKIADLDRAPRAADGRVHVTADLFVLQPVDRRKGNDTMLFDIANRGAKLLLGRFNRVPRQRRPRRPPPTWVTDILMREGYPRVGQAGSSTSRRRACASRPRSRTSRAARARGVRGRREGGRDQRRPASRTIPPRPRTTHPRHCRFATASGRRRARSLAIGGG